MFLLRRAALRSISSASIASRTSRSFTSRTLITRQQPILSQSWSQRRCYNEESDKKNVSPAEQESEETVTEEPVQTDSVVEESIATPDVADAAAPASSESTQEVFDPEPGAAAPEPSSASTGGASEAASSTLEGVKSAVGNAAQTVSSAASSMASSTVDSAQQATRSPRHREEPQPSKILYIGNLFFDLTNDQLRAAFARLGNIVNSKIVTDSSGLSKGFGYVEFETIEEAENAIKEMNNQELEGRRLNVQYHVRRLRPTDRTKATNPPSKTLFVGNMSFQMTDKDLNDLFRQIKDVLDVRVAIDRRSGQPRGFAHADFTSVAAAEKAKKVLESKVVYGRQLRIDYGISSASRQQ